MCTRHHILGLSLLALPALACCGEPPDPRAAARHVLLITVDTLRADRLGAYGNPRDTSPAVDRLAREGVRFERAYATSSTTFPSLVSLMTSKHPSEHGALTNSHGPIPRSELLLGEILEAAGFTTGGFTENGLLAERSGIAQGIGHHKYRPNAKQLTQAALNWMEGSFTPERRAFLWVHYLQPHAPYHSPPEYQALFTSRDYQGPFDGSAESLNRIGAERIELSPSDLEHILGLYDACVRYVDDCAGRLLEKLDELGARDETLVVFLADHGEDLYDRHFYFGHGKSVYASSLRIPLVMRLPGRLPAGIVHEGVVSMVDVLPTLLRLLGLEPPADAAFSGIDVSAALARRDGSGRELAWSQWGDKIVTAHGRRFAFVHNPEEIEPRGLPAQTPYPVARRELYDMEIDPTQKTDLARDPERKAVADDFEAKVAAWKRSLANPGKPVPNRADRARMAELRKLGYAR